MGSPLFTEVTPLEAAFIKQAEACALLAEVCVFVDYYQDKGCTEGHFRANPQFLRFVEILVRDSRVLP